MGETPISDLLQAASAALVRGAAEEARALGLQAIRLAPGDPEAYFLLGNACARLGNLPEALEHFERARTIAPHNLHILNCLGAAYGANGRPDLALPVLREALAIGPNFPWALENMGVTLRALDDLDGAQLHFERALRLKPDMVGARSGLAALAEHRQEWSALQKHAEAWLTIEPQNYAPWRLLARAHQELGQPHSAIECFRSAFRCGLSGAPALTTYARLCLAALDHESAQAALAQAEDADPDDPTVRSTKALHHMFSGQLDEAERLARACIKTNPKDVTSYRVLTNVTSGKLDGAELRALQELSHDESLPHEDRIAATFATADCYDAQDAVDIAFDAYCRANILSVNHACRQGIVYDPAQRCKEVDRVMSLPLKPPISSQDVAVLPVFIVGMPRSGTTLIESVLASHPKVRALGERAAMRGVVGEFTAHGVQSNNDLYRWRSQYLSGIPLSPDVSIVTDKNPWNFDAIGLILRIFPEAKIIHVTRNPVETGFSIFRNMFSKHLPYTCDLAHIGHYYSEYARLMSHWTHMIGDQFLTISYEHFAANLESEARKLLAYAGLDWHDACASPWKSSRIISTMSNVQGRSATRGPRGRANAYGARLSPLRIALSTAGAH